MQIAHIFQAAALANAAAGQPHSSAFDNSLASVGPSNEPALYSPVSTQEAAHQQPFADVSGTDNAESVLLPDDIKSILPFMAYNADEMTFRGLGLPHSGFAAASVQYAGGTALYDRITSALTPSRNEPFVQNPGGVNLVNEGAFIQSINTALFAISARLAARSIPDGGITPAFISSVLKVALSTFLSFSYTYHTLSLGNISNTLDSIKNTNGLESLAEDPDMKAVFNAIVDAASKNPATQELSQEEIASQLGIVLYDIMAGNPISENRIGRFLEAHHSLEEKFTSIAETNPQLKYLGNVIKQSSASHQPLGRNAFLQDSAISLFTFLKLSGVI
jgi:hypothetical protein